MLDVHTGILTAADRKSRLEIPPEVLHNSAYRADTRH